MLARAQPPPLLEDPPRISIGPSERGGVCLNIWILATPISSNGPSRVNIERHIRYVERKLPLPRLHHASAEDSQRHMPFFLRNSTAWSTEIWWGKVLPKRHIHMLISKSRLPAPLSGLESAAASLGILPLKQWGMLLTDIDGSQYNTILIIQYRFNPLNIDSTNWISMIFLWYRIFIVQYWMIFDIVCLFFNIRGNIDMWYRFLNNNILYVNLYDIVHYVPYLILCLYAGAMFLYNKDSTTYGVASDVVPLFQDEDNNPHVGSRKCCSFLWDLTPEAARNYIDWVAVQVTWNQRHTFKDVCPAQFQISNI